MLEGYIKFIRSVLPSPLSIAIVLTALTFCAVWTLQLIQTGHISPLESMGWWSEGLWTGPLMVFAMQMMLMLVLGHVLALSPFFSGIISNIVRHCDNTAQAAFLVSFFALLVGLFNWGLGLIFGAILARKMGESLNARNIAINYPLIGAAGYAALMIWHGGISGSSLIKVAETDNLRHLLEGVLSSNQMNLIPERIGIDETVFSVGNIVINLIVLITVPSVLYLIGKRHSSEPVSVPLSMQSETSKHELSNIIGAERLDHSALPIKLTGFFITIYCIWQMATSSSNWLDFFNPNNINLLLLGLSLVSHKSFGSFLKAIDAAIGGASGILIQFPLYFGIMALFRESGLIHSFSDFFVRISSPSTYPIFTFLSAGIVNIFVPSGGGQWVIQGPIIIKAALELGIPLHKSILALAYGDQITNMLQPFWALPLLGITKLSARHILPYTLAMFAVGFTIYFVGLLIF